MAKKNVTLIFLLLSLLITISCKVNTKTTESIKYKIISIDSIENVYIIHAKSRDKYFKIVSDKIDETENCEKIKIGKFYNLHLISLFKEKEKFRSEIGGIDFNGQSILFEKDSIYDIYTTTHIKGLYINCQ